MSEPVVLSVRGEAQRSVAPDFAVLHGQLTAFAPSKGEALALVSAAQDAFTTGLARHGGAPLTPETEPKPLTWSVATVGTHDERDFDRDVTDGRVFASADVLVTVRDLPLLAEVADTLARIPALHLHGVSWRVNPDNPAWPAVRAAAIEAALGKGRDYAAALGGSLLRVEQVADGGLLGPDAAGRFDAVPTAALAFGGRSPMPTLDPVPQQLHAVIEARLIAEVPALA